MIDVERVSQSFGIFGAVRRFADAALGIVQNRFELLAVEFKEEKSRLIGMAIWAGAAVFLGFLSLVAIMFTLTLIFWEQRIMVMGIFCGVFVIGTLIAFLMMRSKAKTPPFAESITQLKKDREWLQRK